jgi:hypothetical protein
MGTRHGDLDKRIRHRPAKANQLILVDEAGPCGSWLSRALGNQGDAGWVDVPRVDTPRPLMRDVGRIPSDDARGERRRQGAMTQTGHPPARRARVEGAWASRHPATVSRHRPRRLETCPNAAQDISWKAPVRRGTRDRQRRARGTHAQHVGVAIARQRRALRWARAQEVPGLPAQAPIVLEQRRNASHRPGRGPGLVSPSTA